MLESDLQKTLVRILIVVLLKFLEHKWLQNIYLILVYSVHEGVSQPESAGSWRGGESEAAEREGTHSVRILEKQSSEYIHFIKICHDDLFLIYFF